MQVDGVLRNISIEAIPLPNTLEPYYLILFHDYKKVGSRSQKSEVKKQHHQAKQKKIIRTYAYCN
jgi:hypothetical protein